MCVCMYASCTSDFGTTLLIFKHYLIIPNIKKPSHDT